MAKAFVATSHVSDGSMHNRNDPHDVDIISNRQQWLASQGFSLDQATRVRVSYVEGDDFCRYREVGEANKGEGMMNADFPAADALITTTLGHVLFLPIADCVATTIFDEEHGVLMLTHLGRQSLEQDGGYKSVKYLQDHYSSNPHALKIWLSPTVNKDVYKIYKLDDKGMKEAVYEQLVRAGVDTSNIDDNNDDTATNPDYFSYSEYLKGNKLVDGCYAMAAVLN